MRIIERFQYALGISLATSLFLEAEIVSWSLIALISLLLPLGKWYEGIRLFQIIFYFGFIIQAVCYCFTDSMWTVYVFVAFVLCSIFLSIRFGECDFKNLNMVGPYEVGYTEFRLGNQNKNAVSVFYPMDRGRFNQVIDKTNTKWFPYGQRSMNGMTGASAPYGTKKHAPKWQFEIFENLYMDVANGGQLADDFTRYGKPLIPVVYCHGLSSNRTMQSGSCRDLASHGYIVFIMDFGDNSCYYTEDADQNPQYFDTMHLPEDFLVRKNQISIREEEVKDLIDFIFEKENMLDAIGFQQHIRIELNRLILGGHSFGGMTAISHASRDMRVRAVFALDPWLYVYNGDIFKLQMKVDVPIICISTELFHPAVTDHFKFQSMECMKALLDSGRDPRKESVIMKGCGHIHQVDLISLVPFEIFMQAKYLPRSDGNELYLLNTQLIINFLSRCGFSANSTGTVNMINSRIESMQDQWLTWDQRLDPTINFVPKTDTSTDYSTSMYDTMNESYQPPNLDLLTPQLDLESQLNR